MLAQVSASAFRATGQLTQAPMTSGQQWRLKHRRQATDAAATRALRPGTGAFP